LVIGARLEGEHGASLDVLGSMDSGQSVRPPGRRPRRVHHELRSAPGTELIHRPALLHVSADNNADPVT